jgi:hypothetical protein
MLVYDAAHPRRFDVKIPKSTSCYCVGDRHRNTLAFHTVLVLYGNWVRLVPDSKPGSGRRDWLAV